MSKRYDVISGRKYEVGGVARTNWTRCGVAFAKDDGKISIKLDVHSLSGEYLLVEPRPRASDESQDGDDA